MTQITQILSSVLLNNFLGEKKRFNHYHFVKYNDKEYYASSESHAFIMIPKKNIEYVINEDSLDFANIIGKFDLDIEIDIDILIQLYNSIPIIEMRVDEECPSCEGAGNFDHYGYKYDCQLCNETGKVKSKTKIKVKDPSHIIGIKDNFFKIQFLEKIIDAIKVSGAINVFLKKQAKGLSVFEFDNGIIAGLMCAGAINTDEIKILKL